MTDGPLVFVVDDDPSVRSSLKFLLSTVGLQVESFESAESFLNRKPPNTASCLVLDVRLNGLTDSIVKASLQREIFAFR
jgi:FixJ family two-component response regulator